MSCKKKRMANKEYSCLNKLFVIIFKQEIFLKFPTYMNSGSKLRWMGCLLLPFNFHLESLFTVGFNLSSPRLAKTVPFLI